MPSENEVHLTYTQNGHILSTDCWCEPVEIKMMKNKHGVPALVVEHQDWTLAQHSYVVDVRNMTMHTVCDNFRDFCDPWITRMLNSAFTPPAYNGDPNAH